MNMKIKKILAAIGSVLMIAISITSCSNEEVQKMINTDGNQEEITDRNDEGPDLGKLQLKSLGEEIVVNDNVTEMSYTINKVTVYDSFTDAGLTEEEMGYVPEGEEKKPFVVLDITVKNNKVLMEDAAGDYNIAVFHLMNQKLLEDPWSQALPQMSWFREHKEDDRTYFHYTLEEGQTMECQIGWVLTYPVEDTHDLVLHVGADISSMDYVDLAQEETKNAD